jgi:hypothetical protein
LDASLVTPVQYQTSELFHAQSWKLMCFVQAALAAFRDKHAGVFNIAAVAAEIQECVEVLNDTNERVRVCYAALQLSNHTLILLVGLADHRPGAADSICR